MAVKHHIKVTYSTWNFSTILLLQLASLICQILTNKISWKRQFHVVVMQFCFSKILRWLFRYLMQCCQFWSIILCQHLYGLKLCVKPFNREFKIRRLRTTATDKYATAHDQNHVTVHFSRVVLRLRWVVELFRVVGTTEDILLVLCRPGNSIISSFRKKSFQFTCFKWRGSKIWKF